MHSSFHRLTRVLLWICIATATIAIILKPFELAWSTDLILNEIHDMFNVDREMNIPTWFSTLLLAGASLLLWLIGTKPHETKTRVRDWKILSGIFLYMSLDEMTVLHEVGTVFFRGYFNIQTGVLFHAWVIAAIPIVLILALYFEKFLNALPRRTRRHFIIAGAIYIFGALLMEIFGGWYISTYSKDYFYFLTTVVEEFCEMVGITLFIDALIKYANTHLSRTPESAGS